MATKEKELTYDQHMKLINSSGDHIKNVPAGMVDKEMVKAARANYARVNVIPEKFITFAMVLNDAPSYSQKDAKDFAYKHLNDEWGISVSAFAALAVKGTLPNMKKVPEKFKKHIELACFKKALFRTPEVVFKMPGYILEELKKDSGFIKKVYSGSYSRSSSKFGRDTWIGYKTLSLFSEDDFTGEDIDFIQEDIEKRFTYNDCRIELSLVPEFLVTYKAQEEYLRKSGRNLQYIPVEERTLDLCKIAVEKDGDALQFVPDSLKKEFYLDAVKNGGLGSIPEEDRTDRLCTIAVENNPEEIKRVPLHMRTYAICLIAIDKSAEMLEFVPKENRDQEMIIRFLISVLKKNYKYDFIFNSDWKKEGTEPLLSQAFFSVIDKETTRYSSHIVEAKQKLLQEVVKRDNSVFPMLVKKSQDGSGWPMLQGLVNMDICIEAFKGNKDNVSSIPKDILVRIVSGFIDLNKD